jgi:hypothetical protein
MPPPLIEPSQLGTGTFAVIQLGRNPGHDHVVGWVWSVAATQTQPGFENWVLLSQYLAPNDPNNVPDAGLVTTSFQFVTNTDHTVQGDVTLPPGITRFLNWIRQNYAWAANTNATHIPCSIQRIYPVQIPL